MRQAIAGLLIALGSIAPVALPGGGPIHAVAQPNGASSPCTRKSSEGGEPIAVPCNERLAGDWGGQLTESTGNTYRVEIAIARDGSGTINYPGLSCSGTLDYKMRRGETYIYTETITKNSKKCGNVAEVELTSVSADGSAIDFFWKTAKLDLTVSGRVLGVLVAGATQTSGTNSKPGSDNEDECFKYLPNRGTMVAMPCDAGVTPTN